MNSFEPKKIKEASKHLEEKLKLLQKNNNDDEKNVYKVEGKKDSSFQRFVNLIFKS